WGDHSTVEPSSTARSWAPRISTLDMSLHSATLRGVPAWDASRAVQNPSRTGGQDCLQIERFSFACDVGFAGILGGPKTASLQRGGGVVSGKLLSWALVASLVGGPAPLVDPDIEKGIKQVEDGDFDTAIITLDNAARHLAADPGRAKELSQAYLYLGIAYVGK